MNDVTAILAGLQNTPMLLQSLLDMIPPERMMDRRIPGKWSIHENACHMATVDAEVFIPRMRRFQQEAHPKFVHFSGESLPSDHYEKMNLEGALRAFAKARADLVTRCQGLEFAFWTREAQHPEYDRYTPRVMLRHLLLHDCLHMYRIEELWLTRDEYLSRRT